MRLLALVLAAAVLAVIIALGAGLALVGDGRVADGAAPEVLTRLDPSESGSEEVELTGTTPERTPVPFLPELSQEPAPQPTPERPSQVVVGPVTRGYFAGGELQFEGGQVLGERDVWLREGAWEAWHENGQLHEEGAYHLDEETGLWRWWYENGQQMAEGRFIDGEREGLWHYWHDNGNKMTECSYEAGSAHGLWRQYHENGVQSALGEFVRGELQGAWTVWHEDGTLNLDGTGTYDSGDRTGD